MEMQVPLQGVMKIAPHQVNKFTVRNQISFIPHPKYYLQVMPAWHIGQKVHSLK
jgi:hypothetical protein